VAFVRDAAFPFYLRVRAGAGLAAILDRNLKLFVYHLGISHERNGVVEERVAALEVLEVLLVKILCVDDLPRPFGWNSWLCHSSHRWKGGLRIGIDSQFIGGINAMDVVSVAAHVIFFVLMIHLSIVQEHVCTYRLIRIMKSSRAEVD